MQNEHSQNGEVLRRTDITVVVDQENLEYKHARTLRSVIWKLDKRLIPFLFLLEFSFYINRISIGNTKTNSLKHDLNLSMSDDKWTISLFFLALLIFDIPSIFLLRIIGPTRYLSWSMIAWGSITIGMAFVKNARELLAIRFLLGMAEAGYFPGIIIYFSMWYRKREQTMRMAIFCDAAILAGAVASILAYGISKLDGIGGLHGWQWIFLLEGLPIVLLGFITYFFLKNISDTVQWLSNCEKEILTNMLRDDAGAADSDSASSARLSWRQVYYSFIDWRIYLYTAITIGNLALVKCLTTYLPNLVQNMGYSTAEAQLMSALPYIVAGVCALVGSFFSSRHNEHGYHLTFFLVVCVIGFVLLATCLTKGKAVMYVGTCMVSSGIRTSFPILMSWLTKNVGGHTKRAMAVGFAMGLGQIGGVVAPLIYRDEDAPTFRRGHIICAAITSASLLITLSLRFALKKENDRRDSLTQAQHDKEAQVKEPCDWHPDVRYIL